MTVTPNTGPRYSKPPGKPDFSQRTTPEGMPGTLVEHHEDGSIERLPITTTSLRDVFPVTIEDVPVEESIENQGGNV